MRPDGATSTHVITKPLPSGAAASDGANASTPASDDGMARVTPVACALPSSRVRKIRSPPSADILHAIATPARSRAIATAAVVKRAGALLAAIGPETTSGPTIGCAIAARDEKRTTPITRKGVRISRLIRGKKVIRPSTDAAAGQAR